MCGATPPTYTRAIALLVPYVGAIQAVLLNTESGAKRRATAATPRPFFRLRNFISTEILAWGTPRMRPKMLGML